MRDKLYTDIDDELFFIASMNTGVPLLCQYCEYRACKHYWIVAVLRAAISSSAKLATLLYSWWKLFHWILKPNIIKQPGCFI